MLVKICGLREPAHVRVAVEAGATAVGLVLCASPRQVDVSTAARLLQEIPAGVASVAVVRVPTDEELGHIRDLGFDAVQADADWQAPDDAPPWLPSFTDGPSLQERVRRWGPPERGWRGLVLVDGPRGGGLGERADLQRVAGLAQQRPVVLAGGLDPDNVAAAIADVRPAGVDVSSGIERSRGVKDPVKIRAFVQAALQAIGDAP